MTTDQEFAELSDFDIDPHAVRRLPREFCRRNMVVILGTISADLETPVTVGMTRPDNGEIQRQIADLLQQRVEAVRLNQYEIKKVLEDVYDHSRDLEAIPDRSRQTNLTSAQALVEHTLSKAVKSEASDIHIDTYEDDVDVRFRIDGILHQTYTDISPANVDQVINRIKVMSDLDITERRRPQDGRITRTVKLRGDEPRDIDFRISIVPCPAGEDVVIRVLDAEAGLLPLTDLGMDDDTENTFLQLLENPEGLILVTGPTGSGKTTTLYAALQQINDGRRKIITAEDPIEYNLDKINQKQVSEEMPLPVLLRALLRQDPDVMLVGEVRDQITGETALAAANTGHVVFGTVHTPDAVGTITRLRGLDLDDSELGDALLAVVSQRLARCVCEECKEQVEPTDRQIKKFGPDIEDLTLFEGPGCSSCQHTGYDGRIGLFELLVIDRTLQNMIAEGRHSSDLQTYADSRGHRALLADAFAKADRGLTSLEEIERIVPYRQIMDYR